MARVEPEHLEGRDLARVYIAPKLREAKEVEEVLTGHGVDYVVSVEPILRSLFGSTRNAAVFLVKAEDAEASADLLTQAGLGLGVVPEDRR